MQSLDEMSNFCSIDSSHQFWFMSKDWRYPWISLSQCFFSFERQNKCMSSDHRFWREKDCALWLYDRRVFASSYKRIKALVIVLYGDLTWEVPEALPALLSCSFKFPRALNLLTHVLILKYYLIIIQLLQNSYMPKLNFCILHLILGTLKCCNYRLRTGGSLELGRVICALSSHCRKFTTVCCWGVLRSQERYVDPSRYLFLNGMLHLFSLYFFVST